MKLELVARAAWFMVRVPVVALIVWFNVNLWTLNPAAPLRTAASLDAITDDLRQGAGDEMQALFPEGYVITHAIAGFGWVDVALDAPAGSAEQRHALEQARWLESRVDTEHGRAIFSPTSQPAYGAFYRGYLAWLRGGILLADPVDPADEVARFRQDCDEIATALRAANTPYLESYPRLAWPADSVFLAASLALHDKLFEPLYQADLARWATMVTERLDGELGLIPHAAVPGTGAVHVEPRGVSSALMSRMLYEIDVELAADQYRKTREHFIIAHAGLFPGVLEHAKGRGGEGDVDSGPLIAGISASASTVGVAAAKFHGDREFADPTLIGLHAAGFAAFDRYAVGLLPVGEAFLAWTKSARPWVGPAPEVRQWPALMMPGWRFVWHGMSLLALALLFAGELWRLRSRFKSER